MKIALFLLCLALGWNCQAAPFAATDKQRIQSTIRALFDRLRHGDIEAVYGMNTEETRKTFGSPARFHAMLKEHYPQLHAHKSATVTDMNRAAGAIAVTVLVVDRQGGQWTALFMMKPHARAWQVESCVVLPAAVAIMNVI